jgi:hypothetical protein
VQFRHSDILKESFIRVGHLFLFCEVLLLSAALLLTPIPLSNIPPAVVIILIALAYIEEDGLLLGISMFGAFLLIGSAAAALW